MSNNDTQEPTRRGFFGRLALWITGLAVGGSAFVTVRSLVPNVLYEPSKKIKIGPLSATPEGVTFYKSAKAYIFKKSKGTKTELHAVSALCTHLGCMVTYTGSDPAQQAEKDAKAVGFSCPCHGSQFSIEGEVLGGPAPAPLAWLALSVSPDDGQLIVDTGTHVDKESSLIVSNDENSPIRKV